MATIRPEADSVIAVIKSCYRECDGCVLLVDKEVTELRSPASFFASIGGNFWAAEKYVIGIETIIIRAQDLLKHPSGRS